MEVEAVVREPSELVPNSPSLAIQLHCVDPAEVAAVTNYWNWELDRLEPGEFHGSVTILQLGHLLVTKVDVNRAALHRLACPANGRAMLMRGEGSAPIFVAGLLLQPSDFVLLDRRTEIELLGHGTGAIVAISLHGAADTRLNVSATGKPLPLSGGARLLSCPAGNLIDIPDCVDKATAALLSHGGAYPDSFARATLTQELLVRLNMAMENAVPVEVNRLRPTRRRVAVERARDFIRQRLTDPIRLADLCQYSHVQERSLEYGFREIVGLRPMTYIKMLRLAEVHRRLLAELSIERSISEVALDSGFCHLGQFAYDYKRLFMESPSTTRRRARWRTDPTTPAFTNGGNGAMPSTRPNPVLDGYGAESRKYLS
jgi:AraC family ethanolamine operon transcriptional activator